jgi:hygromycin-B 7''-O-kinase
MSVNRKSDNRQQHNLDVLKAIDGYRQHFMDAVYWQPYVKMVCQRHKLRPAEVVDTGLPGTYPTFIVDEHWVIKFFGELFNGADTFEVERQVNQLIEANQTIVAPALIVWGHLFENTAGWSWPYLIFEFIPGVSLGEVYEQVGFDDKLVLAQNLAQITRQLHAHLPARPSSNQLTWEAYVNLIKKQYVTCQRIQQAAEAVPNHLAQQIDTFLPPLDRLIGPGIRPCLIHADLTADHILGQLKNGAWTTNGLIDFGDAMVGDFVYELIALHLDLFRGDKRLLAVYLAAYGVDDQFYQSLPTKAMSLTLLHRFDVFGYVCKTYPQVSEATSLEEAAILLWDVNKGHAV